LNAKPPIMRLVAAGWLVFCTAVLVGCAQNLSEQPRYKPLDPSEFFPDGASARQPVPGTVARGRLDNDPQFYAGKINTQPSQPTPGTNTQGQTGQTGNGDQGNGAVPPGTTEQPGDPNSGAMVQGIVGVGEDTTTFPYPVTRSILERGHERYNIYCMPCHGLAGYGDGMIVQRGFSPPPSFHTDRLRQAPVGHFYDVITNGYGAMYSYASRVSPDDRWAIIAYIRALQLSQHATIADVPPEEQQKLQGTGQ
jgi:mono/diheme cytochrome c family protein